MNERRIGKLDGRRILDPFHPDSPSWRPTRSSHDLENGDWLTFEPAGRNANSLDLLARANTPQAGLYALAAEVGCSPLHGPRVMAEANAWAERPQITDPKLQDLTSLPFISIDEETSKDLDQALFVESIPDGFRVWYAIADAAHFVARRGGRALMSDALERGSTYYMPGLVLPMLPPILSEDLVSLNPHVDRRALVFRIELESDGTPRDTQLLRARIRSRLKTSYDAVQSWYDGEKRPWPERAVSGPSGTEERIFQSLEALAGVGRARMDLAAIRHTVRLKRRELKVAPAPGSAGFVAMDDPRLDSERFNEQLSLLANIEGARLLAREAPGLDSVQPIFRFHRPPDTYGLDRLRGRLRALARRHRLRDERWHWRPSRQSLADFLDGLPKDAEHERICRAVHRQVLLAGGRSGFDSAPGIHHGVGAEAYARFTAPMREVVGVFVHKETWEMLGEAKPASDADDEILRDQVIEAAQRSRQTQRRLDAQVNRKVIDQLLEAEPDRGYGATVMGVSKSKVHLQLDPAPVDLKVYISHLEEQHGERLVMGRDGVTLRRARDGHREHTVGDAVRVRALGRDARNDRWRLAVEPMGDNS